MNKNIRKGRKKIVSLYIIKEGVKGISLLAFLPFMASFLYLRDKFASYVSHLSNLRHPKAPTLMRYISKYGPRTPQHINSIHGEIAVRIDNGIDNGEYLFEHSKNDSDNFPYVCIGKIKSKGSIYAPKRPSPDYSRNADLKKGFRYFFDYEPVSKEEQKRVQKYLEALLEEGNY